MNSNINPKPIDLLMIGDKKIEYYKDLLIKADNGLHAQVFSIIDQIFRDKNGIKILDIASGEGSLSYRLFNSGFKNIDAADINSDDFRFSDCIRFTKINLNEYTEVNNFVKSHSNEYDLIVGIETIEHIENPWLYVRMLKALLKDKGTLIISTPNINSIFSKIYFILKDRFFQFSESDLSYYHINPISTFEFETICQHNDLEIMKILPGGKYPIIWARRDILFSILFSLSNVLLYPIAKGQKFGWCTIYIIQKSRN